MRAVPASGGVAGYGVGDQEGTMRLMRAAALTPLLLFLLACGGAGTGGARTAEGTPPQPGASGGAAPHVVATFSVLADLVRNVGGDRIQLDTVVGAGADAHTFEPSPADSVRLKEADLVFEHGLGFEPWLPELYESSGSAAARVPVTRGLKDLLEAGGEGDRAEYDPHVWHDPRYVITIVETIRDALSEANAADAGTYRANADRYVARLRELDGEIESQVSRVPEARRKLVTTHDTFAYFARRYNFEVVDSILGASTEENEPSAAEVSKIVREIRASGVPAIFVENVSNPGVTERIAQETGVEIAPPLYTDALGDPGSEGETYLEMMRYNAGTIAEALGR